MGITSYFNIPSEYVLIDYNLSIYNIILCSSIFLSYWGIAVITVRIWLSKRSLKIKIIGISSCILIPPLLPITIFPVSFFDNTNEFFAFFTTNWLPSIIGLFSALLTLHVILIFVLGYCYSLPIRSDLIDEKTKKYSNFTQTPSQKKI